MIGFFDLHKVISLITLKSANVDKEFMMKRSIIQISLLLFGYFLNAQQPFSNTGNLQVHSGGAMTSFGNFVNTGTGNLVNNGNLYVRANFTNAQSSMAPGTGTLYLNGTGVQSVDGSQPVRTFNLVTNNNSVAGITLNNNLSVSGSHTFTDGIISTSTTPNYMIYEAGSSYSGDGDGQHINGWVKKFGNTNFSFPVGNGSVIRKAAVESLSGNLEFNARYNAPNPTSANVQTPLELVDPEEFWTINRVSASGSANIHLNWDDSRVNFPEYLLSAIRVAHYTGSLWTDIGGSAIGNVSTTGNITSNSVNSFGDFTFGSNAFLLPLRFVSITAQRKADYNFVEWKTITATNTDHFEIERSEDGLHFKKIGTAVSYNSISERSYFFTDMNLSPGTLWYRIRCVDKDGKFTLSALVSVNDRQANRSMYILNNPARGSIHLYTPASFKGKCDYYLSGTNGQLTQAGTFIVNNAGNMFIKLQDGVTPGIYILHIRNNKNQFQEKVVIK